MAACTDLPAPVSRYKEILAFTCRLLPAISDFMIRGRKELQKNPTFFASNLRAALLPAEKRILCPASTLVS
jgi:hypothetical protein